MDLQALAEQAEVFPRGYTVGFGDRGDLDEELLISIARRMNGEYFYGGGAGDLGNVFIKTQHHGTGNVQAEFEGTILPGELIEAGHFTLQRGESELRVSLNWPGSEVEMQLYDPQGRLVDADYRGIKIRRVQRPAYVVLENPRSGQWRVELFGRDVSGDGTSYYVVASTSDIVIEERKELEFFLVLATLGLLALVFAPRLLRSRIDRREVS